MPTLKDTITQELLDSVDDPGGLEEVFRRRSGSKGPFYLGLAGATTLLQERLSERQEEVARRESSRNDLNREVDSLEARRQESEARARELDEEVRQAEAGLKDVQSLLDRAEQLERAGFGEEELARLADLLAQVAVSQGATPEEGVAQFFMTVARYGELVSLDLEMERARSRADEAKAEAERWEVEAKGKEAHTRARAATIDLAERLLEQGVKEEDLLSWEEVLRKTGASAQDLVDILEHYGSVEGLVQARQERAGELQSQTKKLDSQLEALTREQEALHAAIEVVRDKAVGEVKRAGKEIVREVKAAGGQAKQHVDAVAEAAVEHRRLQVEAMSLQDEVQLTRALLKGDEQTWGSAPREFIANLLLRIMQWTQTGANDIAVPVLPSISRSGMVPQHSRLNLSQVLLWALTGMFTDAELKTLTAR